MIVSIFSAITHSLPMFLSKVHKEECSFNNENSFHNGNPMLPMHHFRSNYPSLSFYFASWRKKSMSPLKSLMHRCFPQSFYCQVTFNQNSNGCSMLRMHQFRSENKSIPRGNFLLSAAHSNLRCILPFLFITLSWSPIQRLRLKYIPLWKSKLKLRKVGCCQFWWIFTDVRIESRFGGLGVECHPSFLWPSDCLGFNSHDNIEPSSLLPILIDTHWCARVENNSLVDWK